MHIILKTIKKSCNLLHKSNWATDSDMRKTRVVQCLHQEKGKGILHSIYIRGEKGGSRCNISSNAKKGRVLG